MDAFHWLYDRANHEGVEAVPTTPAEFDKLMRHEMDDAAKVIKAVGIKMQ